MKKLLLLAILAASLPAHAGTAFLSHDYISGSNRICVYDDMGDEFYITVEAYELCPLTIET